MSARPNSKNSPDASTPSTPLPEGLLDDPTQPISLPASANPTGTEDQEPELEELMIDDLDGETRAMSRLRETFVGPYQIDVKLGDGGMGNVYKALDPKLGRYVAVKVIKDELAFNERYLERLGREARTLASVSHSSVIQIYAFQDSRETPETLPYLVMEFVDGQSLDALLRREKQLDFLLALRLARETAAGLQAALDQGIIHRDIKPSNLLISKEGHLKIVDFGLAKEVESSVSITSDGIVLGTPEYISPEQAQGEHVDHRSDIYSFGCTLYHMLTGRPVFTEKSRSKILYAHIYQAPAPPHRINTKLPEACSQVIGKMLAKEPSQRYESYGELIADLECLECGKTPGKNARDAARRTYRGPGPHPLKLWLGSTAAVVGIFLLGIFVAKRFSPPELDNVYSNLADFRTDVPCPNDAGECSSFEFSFDGSQDPDPIDEFFLVTGDSPARPQISDSLVWNGYTEPLVFVFPLEEIQQIRLHDVTFSGPGNLAVIICDPVTSKRRELKFVFDASRRLVNPIQTSRSGETDNPETEALLALGEQSHDITITLNTDENDTEVQLAVYTKDGNRTNQVYPRRAGSVVLPGPDWAGGALVLDVRSSLSASSFSIGSLEIDSLGINDKPITDNPIEPTIDS